MPLRSLTGAVIATLVLSFVLRLGATLSPASISSLAVARTVVLVQLLAALALLGFFLAFRSSAFLTPPAERPALHLATHVASAGAVVGLLLPGAALLELLRSDLPAGQVLPPWAEAMAPLVATLTFFAFALTLHRSLRDSERPALAIPSLTAAIGYALFATLNLVVAVSWLTAGDLRWLGERSPTVLAIALPLAALGLIGVLWLYVALYRWLGPPHREEQAAA